MNSSEYLHPIEDAIGSLLSYPKSLDSLYRPIAYGLDAGGKRLRPMLTLMAARACGADISTAMPAAIAVEMFHNFTLLHDDVMDASPTRRGRDSVWKKWDTNTAILSGDTLFALACRKLMQLPSDTLPAALKMFTDSAIRVMEGQQYDMDFESRENVTLPEYIEMIRLKTSVLLGCAAALGAIAAGADTKTADAFYRYAEDLGLAFQIQDDWLDVYADPDTFGKPIGGDILNAKKTYLTLTCLTTDHAGALTQAMAMPATQERIDAVRDIYDKAGIPRICRKAIDVYTESALSALNEIEMPDTMRKQFTDLAQSLINRQK